MIQNRQKQQFDEIWPINFLNDDVINAQLVNKGKSLVALKSKYPLNSVVYPISEVNSSNPLNELICFKQSR